MRSLLVALSFVILGLPTGAQPPQDPPGMMVIRPKPKADSSATVSQRLPRPRIVEDDPTRPGLLVIRPRPGTSSIPLSSPSQRTLEGSVPGHYGSVMVIKPKGAGAEPVAPASATPFVNAKGMLPAPQPPAGEATPPKPAAELPADPSKGKLVRDTWDAVFVKAMHIGYVHTSVREFEKDGSKFLYATKELRQTVSRFGQRVEMYEEETTFETPDGQVLVYRRKQGVGRNQVLAVTGTVSGKSIVLKGEGAAGGMNETVPWNEGVIGIAKEATIVKDKMPKPGESFTYLMFAGQVNWVGKYTVTGKANENVALYAGEAPRNLLKVEVQMDPIRDKQGTTFALPASTVWHDVASGEPLKAEFDMPPLGGMMTVTRTTREAALRPPGNVPELFDVQSIKLDKAVPGIHQRSIGPLPPSPTLRRSLTARGSRSTLTTSL
jgi:hypothetical protein